MFIAGVVVGPAVAMVAADMLFTPGRMSVRWIALAVTILLVAIAVIPFFTTELKVGLLIGVPLGLLLAATPLSLGPSGSQIES